MKRTAIVSAIAAAGMVVTAGAASAQYAKGPAINAGAGSGIDTQIIGTTVMSLINSKVAMPQMRNKFMNDPNVVGAMEAQIIPTMQQQMNRMSGMTANLQY